MSSAAATHHLPASPETVHWGHFDASSTLRLCGLKSIGAWGRALSYSARYAQRKATEDNDVITGNSKNSLRWYMDRWRICLRGLAMV